MRLYYERTIGKLIIAVLLIINITACGGDENQPQQINISRFDSGQTLETNIDAALEPLIDGNDPGAMVKVIYGNEEFTKAYGLANLDTQTPITETTPFNLASISKTMTATAILLLQERGELDISDNLTAYLLETPDSWSDVTLHHLLSHTSGVPNLQPNQSNITNDDIVTWAFDQSLDFNPGAQFSYSNTNYVILASIIETVSQQSFDEFMTDNIFIPSGMTTTTTVTNSSANQINRAYGYYSDGGDFDYVNTLVGSTGILSSAEDLQRWAEAINSNAIISEQSQNMAWQTQLNSFGYGWRIGNANSDRLFFHDGRTQGFITYFMILPERDFSIILLSNGDYQWLPSISDRIIEYYYTR